MINWKVRIRNRAFWLSAIPAVLLLVQSVAAMFGRNLELDAFGSRLAAIVNQLFLLLTLLGIINDPTTQGISDSERAMGYEYPAE